MESSQQEFGAGGVPCNAQTSDYYRTKDLPQRFEHPDVFKGYGKKPQHPMYTTEASTYGSKPPSVHTVPLCFNARSQGFSGAKEVILIRSSIKQKEEITGRTKIYLVTVFLLYEGTEYWKVIWKGYALFLDLNLGILRNYSPHCLRWSPIVEEKIVCLRQHLAKCGMPRNFSLNTSTDKSVV